MKLLLVEDNHRMSVALTRILEKESFVTDMVATLDQARAAMQVFTYDLVLLDRMLPDGDGLELLDWANRQGRPSRFIILSALDQPTERIEGLELGAYDYVVKPFDPRELLARMRVALRHPAGGARPHIAVGNVEYDRETRAFFIGSHPFLVRRKEHILLETLIVRSGRIVSRDAIEEALYGFEAAIDSNSIESHISRLRRKLREEKATAIVETVRGLGYRIRDGDGDGA